MYYSSGNFEAFARPKKPKDIESKKAYLVGSGLASLSAAAFLVRDAQMQGKNIHILEELNIAGGACDGLEMPEKGFVIRGGREMENHFECLWDLFSSIPSLESEGVSVLDEFYWLNKEDPNFSLMRATQNRGQSAHTDGKFTLSPKASLELIKLFFTKDSDLYDKTIDDVFDEEFYKSNFWLYWQTMFAFEKWHSALEIKLYIQRFIHHIGGLPDFSALKFTKYNQYESLIQPLVSYLQSHGVVFEYGVRVKNVHFEFSQDKKIAKRIELIRDGKEDSIALTPNDLVFVTNGSCTESSALGDNTHAPKLSVNNGEGGCWELWRNIATQDKAFGNPAKFCSNIKATNWESATITLLDDKITPYLQKICKRDPHSGKVVTGGIITIKDSSWLMSYTFNRQPHFKKQPKNQLVGWIYGLYTDREGDYIKKPMKECSGQEIAQEWLYHLGVEEDKIAELVKSTNTIPCLMPYITAFFMPRKSGDRPKVVPDGCINFAFIGQFSDTIRDTVFTTEYSVRTAMEAVYTLCEVDRGVPEVFNSCYDIRCLLEATSKLLDGKKITDIDMSFMEKIGLNLVIKKLKGTFFEEFLHRYKLI
ncbi:oleate hydratase [uncultured Helicobacter sp.]|uniref:oleate hydratase n=1 Tax=uncultured Helicobacter sp. TaxID=175537 RepID=UPI0025888D90|nr:oleate hydratase [uncultured Helicobacter sp.]